MKVAVVGATGMVGRIMLKVLEERMFPVTELIPVASERSIGQKIKFNKKEYSVTGMREAIEKKPHIALFSAGGGTSLQWAPEFAAVNTIVIDNSSAWRMDPKIPLVVPEINAGRISGENKIIANPNCSTIQMVMVLAPLQKRYGLNKLIISTYQSVTGTGQKAFDQLMAERSGSAAEMVYPYQIDLNCIPHCDVFMENGYTKEEMKLVNETRKILEDPSISISATAVRVPVVGGHSESIYALLKEDCNLEEIRQILQATPGVILQDDPQNNVYPMPFYSKNKNEVFVGRLRKDPEDKRGLNMWIVSDNLRKGAATNAVQIAEYLVSQDII